MSFVEARARFAGIALRRLGVLFAWRGRIVSRLFCCEVRFYDRAVRTAIEAILDKLEMWQLEPSFRRMRAMCEAADVAVARLLATRKRLGLDDRRPETATNEGAKR